MNQAGQTFGVHVYILHRQIGRQKNRHTGRQKKANKQTNILTNHRTKQQQPNKQTMKQIKNHFDTDRNFACSKQKAPNRDKLQRKKGKRKHFY